MKKIAIVYASRYGHTKLLAEHVASGAASVDDSEVVLYTVEEAEKSLAQLDIADAIILGTATYMGSMASELKHFMEAAHSICRNARHVEKSPGALQKILFLERRYGR